MSNILYTKEDCKAIRCPYLIRENYCKRYGELGHLFSCPDLDVTTARHEAGLW